jgi:GT2 family glycosyltransferase
MQIENGLILNSDKTFSVSKGSMESLSQGSSPQSTETMAGQKVPGRIHTLLRLVAYTLRHPVLTLRLVNRETIKQAMNALFFQSPNNANNVVNQFFETHIKPKKPLESLLDFNRPVSNEKISFLRNAKPIVSIIIPVFNQFDTTLTCLWQIKQNTDKIAYEVIIADDKSTDETIRIKQRVSGAIVIRNKENLGFLKNCNQAARQANGRYLIFLNNDAFVRPGWLTDLVEVVEGDETVGIVGPKFVSSDGRIQEAGGIIWSDGNAWNYGRNDDPEKPEYNYVKDVDYISGACLLIRKNLWDEIGGFDPRFAPAYYEDADLAFEVRKRGFRVVYQPLSVVWHVEGVSHGLDEMDGIKKYQVRNREIFFHKHEAVLKQEHFPGPQQIFNARDRSRHKKTILVIDHYVPHFDQDAGSRSTYQYLQLFADNGLNVIFLPDNFYRHEPYTTKLLQIGIEVLYGGWYAVHWKNWIKENTACIDYVYMMRPHIASKYIDTVKKLKGPRVLYMVIDLHCLRIRRQYEIEQDKKLLSAAKKWEKKEVSLFKKADVTYSFSDVEVQTIIDLVPQSCARQIPLYLFDMIEPIQTLLNERQGLLFVGFFRHTPNVDAVLWFVRHVFPEIQTHIPGIMFNIIGSELPDSIRRLSGKQVNIIGEVSDDELAIWYKRIRLVVVPLRYGAGVNGKILESLRFQVPVITTTIGAEGLPVAATYLRIADDPKLFAKSVIDLYDDEIAWKAQAEAGRSALGKHFSKQRALEILGKDIRFTPSPSRES